MPEGRSSRKRKAIVEAATRLFLEQGYDGTSMDQVAAQAAVSKQTVYKQYADKDSLFAQVILGLADTVDAFIDTVSQLLASPKDVEQALKQLARTYIRTVMQPHVLQPRRLLIGQATRFPELARAYYDRAPERTIAVLASCFGDLAARGLLQAPDALMAARHYAALVLSMPLDKALVCGDDARPSAAELDRLAEAGVDVFLAKYGPRLKGA